MIRIKVIALLLTFCATASAQNEPKFEIAAGTDNDAFAWYKASDRYYNYGISLAFRYKPFHDKLTQVIFVNTELIAEFNYGIQAFTPGNFDSDSNPLDRPFAGWHYLGYGLKINSRLSSFYIGANGGVLGPRSGAGRFQNWFRKQIGDQQMEGWDDQIQNQLGVHVLINYNRTLLTIDPADLLLESNSSIGNIFLHTTTTLRARIGLFSPNTSSSIYGNKLQDPTKNEYFFTVSGGFKLIGYNAAIQGGVFNDQLVSAENLNRGVGIFSFGFFASMKRFSSSFELTHTRGEVAEGLDHKYGSLKVSYIF